MKPHHTLLDQSTDNDDEKSESSSHTNITEGAAKYHNLQHYVPQNVSQTYKKILKIMKNDNVNIHTAALLDTSINIIFIH